MTLNDALQCKSFDVYSEHRLNQKYHRRLFSNTGLNTRTKDRENPMKGIVKSKDKVLQIYPNKPKHLG